MIYEPVVVATTWNTGESGSTIVRQPDRAELLASTLELSNGDEVTALAVMPRLDLELSASATPAAIAAGQNSQLSVDVDLRRGLATELLGGNNQDGAMFDLRASAEVTISGFTISTVESTGTADLDIYRKTGSHVGFEDGSGDWTRIGEFRGVPAGTGRFLALSAPFELASGDTTAIYITRTDDGRLRYANGSGVGNVAAAGDGLEVLEGKGVENLFGRTYSPRVLETIVHFERRDADKLAYDWSSGDTTRTATVAPTATTAYSVDVSRDGCVRTGNVTVNVDTDGTPLDGAPLILRDGFER